MGRDRELFERTLEALRQRLTVDGPLQGAPLAVNVLAAQLDVSQTPVREALAWLAGEGLISHTRSGYAGVVHDAASLAGLYGLAGILSLTLVRARAGGVKARATLPETVLWLADQADNRALARETFRAHAQLAPFVLAERLCLSPEKWPPEMGWPRGEGPGDASALAEPVRRYYARRVRRSAAILSAAISAQIAPRL